MKPFYLNEQQLATLKSGAIVEDCEDGYVGLFNGKPYSFILMSSVKFNKVLPCNEQVSGITTLSGKENTELEQVLKDNPNATITIYRGTAYDDNGNVINKDINNPEYTTRVTKLIITGDLENGKLVSVRIVNQVRVKRFKAKEPARVSKVESVEF